MPLTAFVLILMTSFSNYFISICCTGSTFDQISKDISISHPCYKCQLSTILENFLSSKARVSALNHHFVGAGLKFRLNYQTCHLASNSANGCIDLSHYCVLIIVGRHGNLVVPVSGLNFLFFLKMFCWTLFVIFGSLVSSQTEFPTPTDRY